MSLTRWLPFAGYAETLAGVSFSWWMLAATAMNVLVVRGALRRAARRRGRVDVGGLLRATGALAVALAVELAVLVPLGADHFGAASLLWYVVSVVTPLAAGGVLVARARGAGVSAAATALCVLPVAWAPVTLWAAVGEPYRLVVEAARVPLRADVAGSTPVRLGVLADLQCEEIGPHEQRAVATLRDLAPDLVLVAGDLLQGQPGHVEARLPALRALLESLAPPHGTWIVVGDADHAPLLHRLVDGTDLRLLVDETATIPVGDRTLRLHGVGMPRRTGRLTLHGHEKLYEPDTLAALAAFEAGARDDRGSVHVVLAHHPRVVDALSGDGAVDLVVGGHTHGGQVVLPGVGALVKASPLPFEVARGGLHERNGTTLCVSRGVGMERWLAPRVRLLCPPEISLIEIAPVPPAP